LYRRCFTVHAANQVKWEAEMLSKFLCGARGLPLAWSIAASCLLSVSAAFASSSQPLQIKTDVASGAATVTIELPRDADASSLLVKMNGEDVTDRFQQVSCGSPQCASATLDANDGLAEGKNVIASMVKSQDGSPLTARARFDAHLSTMRVTALAATAQTQELAGAVSTPFLPPTVTLRSLNDGGFNRTAPWIQVGQQKYPTTLPSTCTTSSIYAVIVLDRRTLVQKTSAPGSSPQCFDNAGALKSYFAQLQTGDLVIAGTLAGKNADKGLDTSAIGGQAWPGDVGTIELPAGYMVIGAVGATAKSAYESYYVVGGATSAATPFATGMLQEDANGNYNFQSTDMVEYFVVPNAPTGQFHIGGPTSVVTVEVPPTARTSYRFISYSPYITNDNRYQDGYWLMAVDRKTLDARNAAGFGCADGEIVGNTLYGKGCGKFYRTGAATHASESASEYQRLSNDLEKLYQDPWTLVFLVTVRQASCCSPITAVRGKGTSSDPYVNGFDYLAASLVKFGGTPYATVYKEGQDNKNYIPVYSLVTAAGLGDPLTGNTVESSSAFSQQAQTGTVHGTLARNLNGLYTPSQTSQETYDTLIAKGGTETEDFVLQRTANQLPVDWPVMAGKLPGADSLAGQIDAYRFISISLLRGKYLKEVRGNYQDDLHYFFNGSSNTFIDYHTFDPIDLPLPTLAPATPVPGMLYCTSIDPGDICNANLGSGYGAVRFTMNDFIAARKQTSIEVIYLTNALQFLVTGSTNMKSVIAGGSSSAGLALTGAAATILGSKLVPVPPEQTVNVSWQHIMDMVGGVASIGALIPGIGEIVGTVSTGAKIFGVTANAVSGIATTVSAAGGIYTSSTSSTLPSSFSKFAMTIGELANGSMQGQLATGFDVVVDDITSDWGRLSVIGPRVVDTGNPVFFSPNQAAQNVAVTALTQGASRSFYLALMPSFYGIQYWPRVMTYWEDRNGVTHAPTPDMGVKIQNSCWVFYLPHDSYLMQPYQGMWNWASGREFTRPSSYTFGYTYGGGAWSMIAGETVRAGQSDTNTQLIDPVLANRLFSPSGLNLPLMQFVSKGGPMRSQWVDASENMPQRHPNKNICAGSDYGLYPKGDSAINFVPEEIDSSSPLQPSGTDGLLDTVTTLQAPASVRSGEDLVLNATTLAQGEPVKGGQISFRLDGQEIAVLPIDAKGSATLSVPDLEVGEHEVFASYARVDPYETSISATATVEVTVPSPDVLVTASQSTLQLRRGSAAAPVTVTATSQLGLSGPVQFQCIGLPADMSCTFSPDNASLPANGTATTSLVIASTGPASAMLLLPLLLVPMGLRRRWGRRVAVLAVVAATLGIGGCGGDSEKGERAVQTETVTFVVAAKVGGVMRTMPMTVNVE
jgi:hypothetical protein